MANITSLEQLAQSGLKDLHDVESQIVETLPKLIDSTSSPELVEAFNDHLEKTREHLARIKKILATQDSESNNQKDTAFATLLQEGQKMIDSTTDSVLRDLAIIQAAQKVEHYELGAYKSALVYARVLGQKEAEGLLEETFGEERNASERLEKLAVNICKESTYA